MNFSASLHKIQVVKKSVNFSASLYKIQVVKNQ